MSIVFAILETKVGLLIRYVDFVIGIFLPEKYANVTDGNERTENIHLGTLHAVTYLEVMSH